MDKIAQITSIAAPLPQADIDTDMVLPAQFLLRLDKNLGPFAFASARKQGGFVLDEPRYKEAQILVAGPRFGIGSSREQAVWALLDAGIRCIIAPSFGEIFYNNALRNGLLVLSLAPEAQALAMTAAQELQAVTVDLESQHVVLPDGVTAGFEISAHHRSALLRGLDETEHLLLEHEADIAAFEAQQAQTAPWLRISDEALSTFKFYSPQEGDTV
ncbi:MAG: 3-isopropylmalate dehydratase small subunit [Pseudomonadota bacterium]